MEAIKDTVDKSWFLEVKILSFENAYYRCLRILNTHIVLVVQVSLFEDVNYCRLSIFNIKYQSLTSTSYSYENNRSTKMKIKN